MSLVRYTEPAAGLRQLELDRPEKLNALNRALLDELANSIAETDPETHGVILVSGRGDAFSAGADLDESTDVGDPVDSYQAVTRAARSFPGLVVGQLHGYAIGGGLEIALGFDLRYAAEDTVLRLPEVEFGYAIAAGASQLLPGLVGDGRAREFVLTGREVSAEEAASIGLVTDTLPADELADSVRSIAESAATLPHRGVAHNKRLLNRGRNLSAALEYERIFHELE